MLESALTTAHHYGTLDTTSRAIHVQPVAIWLFYKVMAFVVGVSVAMQAENLCCDSKPDKNVDDLASLDPLNIARDYLQDLWTGHCSVVWQAQKQHSSQSSYKWQQREAADHLWDWRHDICVQFRRMSFLGSVREHFVPVCQAILQAFTPGRKDSLQKLNTWRPVEKWKVQQFLLLRGRLKKRLWWTWFDSILAETQTFCRFRCFVNNVEYR